MTSVVLVQFEKAASILSTIDPPVLLAKVDANEAENKPLANQYEIRGFPTLKIFRYGGSVVQDFKGPRDAEGIVDYVKKQSGPASKEIKSVEDASSVIDENKILVVSIFCYGSLCMQACWTGVFCFILTFI